MNFMMECRIEIEAADLEEAESLADSIESTLNDQSTALEGWLWLYLDAVRPTTGETE